MFVDIFLFVHNTQKDRELYFSLDRVYVSSYLHVLQQKKGPVFKAEPFF